MNTLIKLMIFNTIFSVNKERSPKNLKQGFYLNPESINLKDDGFHGGGLNPFTEWWYFDASFKNNYSVSLAIRVISLLNVKLCLQRLDVYREGKIFCTKRKIFFPNYFYLSKSKPYAQVSGKKIMEGIIDKKGRWNYKLSYDFGDISVNLKFVGTSQGWKSKVPGSMWNVILPRAKVTGSVKLYDNEMKVEGIGYHDHNWNVRPSTIISSIGWFWGRVNSEDHTLIWSDVMHSKNLDTPIFVLNQKNNGYINVNSKNAKFIKKNFKKIGNRKIPHNFNILIKNKKILIDITIKVLEIDHKRIMGFMNYWRYHVVYKGIIKKDTLEEKIVDYQIAELLKFF